MPNCKELLREGNQGRCSPYVASNDQAEVVTALQEDIDIKYLMKKGDSGDK
jgi:hypothetical protein